jgi:DNA-binding NarL/FixJ family response regulator
MRDHLQNSFQASNVFEASDGENGWEQFRHHRPEFCIVDLRLPRLSGEMLINLMQSEPTPPRILVLTGQTLAELPDIVERTDKLFFVEKMAPLEKLNEALSNLFHARKVNSWGTEVNAEAAGPQQKPDQLTRREKTILGMVGEGKSSEAISELLGISVHTVRTHRRNLMQKLRIRTCAVLVRYAMSSGLTGR